MAQRANPAVQKGTLTSTHHTLHQNSPSPATIRIKNIPFTIALSSAWGAPNTPQPLLITASIHFTTAFSTASQLDKLDDSTVSYGDLARAISHAVEPYNSVSLDDDDAGSHNLANLLDVIIEGLTAVKMGAKTVVNVQHVSILDIQATLPKASLLGSGVTMRKAIAYRGGEVIIRSCSLTLHELAVPTLIGVHDYERKCRQMVRTSVTLDLYDGRDLYAELESLVTKTLQESSFETLEALAYHLAESILHSFIIPLRTSRGSRSGEIGVYETIQIVLEKPHGVPRSEAPVVEIVYDTDPRQNEHARGVWDEGGARMGSGPLEGKVVEAWY